MAAPQHANDMFKVALSGDNTASFRDAVCHLTYAARSGDPRTMASRLIQSSVESKQQAGLALLWACDCLKL